MSAPTSPLTPRLIAGFSLIVMGTALGIAGTDLVLPAVPSLPAALGGSAARAQLVLASFVVGTSLGLLAFGELGARFDQRRLFVGSLVAYGVSSVAAGLSHDLDVLIGLRLVQGAASSAAAVFAPGLLRALFDEGRAMRAIGVLGSIEALVPALAPLAGAWLLSRHGFRAPFFVTGGLALLLASALALFGDRLPVPGATRGSGGYLRLLRDRTFLRYAVSHACTLGGLLVLVFGLPAVLLGPLGASLDAFVVIQIVGIAFFILGANVTGYLVPRLGVERVIAFGTALSAAGHFALLAYALSGGGAAQVLAALSIPINFGFGLRGPPGFFRAIVASRGDDARGAALVVLGFLIIAALGTSAVAPFITRGLVPLSIASATIAGVALMAIAALPALSSEGDPTA